MVYATGRALYVFLITGIAPGGLTVIANAPHPAESFRHAEAWDLAFRKSQTPQQRLSARIAIRNDVAKVQKSPRLSGLDLAGD